MLILLNYLKMEFSEDRFEETMMIDKPINKVTGYYGVRPKLTVMKDIKKPSEFFVSLLLTITYLFDLHISKQLFHGDIKPINIFLDLSSQSIITDCGTLIPLYCRDDRQYYRIKTLTPFYSS